MDRITTGNRDLDHVLDGGFPANAIHIVMGSPGSGKTMLAEQLVFANATRERPAVYLTTVSEPLSKFLTYLQEYTFADSSRVGSDVHYVSLDDALGDRSITHVTDAVADIIEHYRPGVLVIDSFKAIADLMPSIPAWRRELHRLAGLLSAYRATSFWIGEYTAEMRLTLPEFAVADGVVELTREQRGTRDFRFVHVAKLRGSAFLDGYHALQITRGGLDVSPRLRTPAVDVAYRTAHERLGSGVPGLDQLIAAGWLRGTTTVVIGPSGAGKSVLALQFLREGVRNGEPGLFLTFEENATQIARVVDQFGWDASTLLGQGRLETFFVSPVELPIDTVVRELWRRVERSGVRRVVIDGVADLAYTASDPVRLRDYLFALTQTFASRGITSLLTVESVSGSERVSREPISYLSDNLVLLQMHLDGDLARTVRVLKTRGSAHDGRRHSLTIDHDGVRVQ